MSNLTTVGIDIAKNFIQIHGEDEKGQVVLKKQIARKKFLPFMANLPKCLIGMEACGGANHWARELTKLGFEARLMSARKVKKYVENNKNDARDAAACCEAVTRPSMTFVPIRTKEQMDIQAIHRIRSFYVKHRTALSNMMRGILLEAGIAIPKGKAALLKTLQLLLSEPSDELNTTMRILLQDLRDALLKADEKIIEQTALLNSLAEKDEYCRQISTLPGIGPITATAVIAKIGNGSEFRKGRDLSAYLGLVPKQNSSGEKQRLLGISKHGDRYLRQLLIHGGRSCLKAAMKIDKKTGLPEKQDEHSLWIRKLADRIGMNKASVAIANKNARMIVALLKNQETFKPAMAH